MVRQRMKREVCPLCGQPLEYADEGDFVTAICVNDACDASTIHREYIGDE